MHGQEIEVLFAMQTMHTQSTASIARLIFSRNVREDIIIPIRCWEELITIYKKKIEKKKLRK